MAVVDGQRGRRGRVEGDGAALARDVHGKGMVSGSADRRPVLAAADGTRAAQRGRASVLAPLRGWWLQGRMDGWQPPRSAGGPVDVLCSGPIGWLTPYMSCDDAVALRRWRAAVWGEGAHASGGMTPRLGSPGFVSHQPGAANGLCSGAGRRLLVSRHSHVVPHYRSVAGLLAHLFPGPPQKWP